jgi:hypothetical protein
MVPKKPATQNICCQFKTKQRTSSSEEIIVAINTWLRNKSPRPDGFTGEFYRTFVSLLAPDLLKVFNNTEQQLCPLNNSYITLILKKSDAKLLKDFHFIIVINGVQKILSKILALRL